jgi:hypothetical protein
MKDKINKLATHSKNTKIRDLHRGIYEFKKSYQPRTNLVKDENGDVLVYSHNILNAWKNYFCQLLDVHKISNIRHMKMLSIIPLRLNCYWELEKL